MNWKIEIRSLGDGRVMGRVAVEATDGQVAEEITGTDPMRNNLVKALMLRLSEIEAALKQRG